VRFKDLICKVLNCKPNLECEDLQKEYEEALTLTQDIKNMLQEWVKVAPRVSETLKEGSLTEQLKQVKELIRQVKNYYIPDFTVNIYRHDTDFIYKKLERLPNFNWDRLRPIDGIFNTTTLEGFKKIIAWDTTNYKRWVLEYFDCDDFSMLFKVRVGLLFKVNAIAWVLDYSSQHAYNIIFPEDSDPLVYEPQTDELFTIEEARKRGYRLEEYTIVI